MDIAGLREKSGSDNPVYQAQSYPSKYEPLVVVYSGSQAIRIVCSDKRYMHIDYEISETDFLNGQRLAVKKSAIRGVRWTLLVLPTFGMLLLLDLVYFAVRQGFSIRFIPGFAICSFFLSIPLLSRREQTKVYAKSITLHGKLSLDVDDRGLRFLGPTSSSDITWEHFGRFLEDDKVFILYQKGDRIFNILPKRGLNPEQIAEFRQLSERHVSKKV